MNTQWPKISLGELLRLERRSVTINPDELYQEIGIYCFNRGVFHKTPRTGFQVGAKDLFQVKEGDFILQVTFAWEGAVALMGRAEDGMYCSTRYPTFRIREDRCLPSFLLHYFKTDEGREQLVRISPGSAGRNRVLSLKRIPEVLIPLPPMLEQHRIVAKIEKLAAQIQEVRSLRNRVSQDAEVLCRSILASDHGAKLTPMHELVMLRSPDVLVLPDQDYQFAGVFCFGRGVFRSQVKRGITFAYPRLTRLRTGDFVYPKLMAWEGAFGVVPPECDGCVVSTEFPVFEILQDKVFPEILDTYFRNPAIWPEIAGASTGTNVRRRRLNPRDFLNYKIPLPNRHVQQRLREVKAKIEALKGLQGESQAELNALLPAILDRAFTGEL